MKDPNTHLATVLYIHSMKKQIEKEVKAKYLKRIDYLVGANNELMNELEQYEHYDRHEKEHVKKVVEEVVDEWRGATCNSHLTGQAIL